MQSETRVTSPSDAGLEITEEEVMGWIENKIELIHSEARVLVDDYWRRLKKEQKNRPYSEQARIGVRIRRRQETLSFSIEWFRMASIRQNGKTKPIARYVKKGRGYRYPLDRILQGEPEWEASLVEELEAEFVDIRRQVDLLGRIRDAVRNYARAIQRTEVPERPSGSIRRQINTLETGED